MGASLSTRARIAVYDSSSAAPRVEEVWEAEPLDYIEKLTSRIYELVSSLGHLVPYTVLREVAENFIHADFTEPVVSILDGGKTIRFADQGPGITDKDRVILPGFTTATGEMKQYIRGVGSGLPIVNDYLTISGGSLVIEDNLGSGAIVTIRTGSRESRPLNGTAFVQEDRGEHSLLNLTPEVLPGHGDEPAPRAHPRLSTRQKQVLALIMESGSAGPSLVSRELGVGISTAYRDLASLEELSLISSDGGKRRLTPDGMTYIGDLMSGM